MLERDKYKLFLLLVKVIPMVIAFIFLLNNIRSYFDIEIKCLNYIVHILLITVLYLLSYILKFCEYHRIFLHYIVITDCINIYDNYYHIPISSYELFILHSIIAGVCLFLILYFKKIRK